MKNFSKLLIYLMAVIGCVCIIAFLLGYRLVNEDYIVADWTSINVFTQALMTVATFSAVYVALEPSRLKLVLHFYMKYNTYADLSMANSQPKLFITNPSNRTAIIHKISIFVDDLDLAYIDFLIDDIERPQIDTVDDRDFGKVQPIIISPNQTVHVAFSVMGLQYVFGHYYDIPDESNKDKKIRIEIVDLNDKKTVLNTNITFGDYYENLVSVLEDKFKEQSELKDNSYV